MPLSRIQSTSNLPRDYQPPGGTAKQRVAADEAGLKFYDPLDEGVKHGYVATASSVPYFDPAESHRFLGLQRGFVRPLFNGRL